MGATTLKRKGRLLSTKSGDKGRITQRMESKSGGRNISIYKHGICRSETSISSSSQRIRDTNIGRADVSEQKLSTFEREKRGYITGAATNASDAAHGNIYGTAEVRLKKSIAAVLTVPTAATTTLAASERTRRLDQALALACASTMGRSTIMPSRRFSSSTLGPEAGSNMSVGSFSVEMFRKPKSVNGAEGGEHDQALPVQRHQKVGT